MDDSRLKKLFDQITELEGKDALKANQLTFLARLLIQITLPHRDPKGAVSWSRRNGDLSFTIQPLIAADKRGKEKNHGIPYGVIPRLLLCWITREAVTKKSPKIILGSSLAEFMAELGMAPTGGRWGSITRLKEQVRRLFSCRITFSYDSARGEARIFPQIADETFFWWDTKNPNQEMIEKSSITLSEKFFQELIANPVPLDMRVLRAIKQSPLALDLYAWLTYRVSYLQAPAAIGWDSLADQFGSHYQNQRHFKAEARKQLKKIAALWPGLRIDAAGRDHLTLYPCLPQVPKRPPKK